MIGVIVVGAVTTTFAGSPTTLRGAIVSLDPLTMRPAVVAFQYNPYTLQRTYALAAGAASGGPETGQLSRPPTETIRVELELDATDDFEAGQPGTVAARLAALENLVTPKAATAIANAVLAAVGTIEILPPETRLTLFVWGASRVLPVVVQELSVTEEAHDTSLVPTRARVSISLRVLTWGDVGPTHPAFALSIAHQLAKEGLGRKATAGSLDAVTGGPATS